MLPLKPCLNRAGNPPIVIHLGLVRSESRSHSQLDGADGFVPEDPDDDNYQLQVRFRIHVNGDLQTDLEIIPAG